MDVKQLHIHIVYHDFDLRQLAKQIKLRPSQLVKLKFIQQEASKDNVNFNLDTYRSVGKDGRDGRDGLV